MLLFYSINIDVSFNMIKKTPVAHNITIKSAKAQGQKHTDIFINNSGSQRIFRFVEKETVCTDITSKNSDQNHTQLLLMYVICLKDGSQHNVR